MSFFRPDLDHPAATPKRAPAWLRPPANVVPVVVPLGLVVARVVDAVVAVPAVHAYPNGLSLALMVRARRRPDGPGGLLHNQFAFNSDSADFVRLGVQFADGRRATNLRRPGPATDEPSGGPRLTPHGGSGSEGAWDTSYWLWPLPPPGRLAIVTEWPAYDIAETTTEVDAELFLEAATRAVTLWEEGADPGGPAPSVR